MNSKKTSKKDEKPSSIRVIEGSEQAITPHNQAVYEAGKGLLTKSPEVGRDFCKTMITVSTGAIATFVGLFKYTLPEGTILKAIEKVILVTPLVLFLAAAMIFVLGLLPQSHEISLDDVTKTNEILKEIISDRRKIITIGVIFFAFSVIFIGISDILLKRKMTRASTT